MLGHFLLQGRKQNTRRTEAPGALRTRVDLTKRLKDIRQHIYCFRCQDPSTSRLLEPPPRRASSFVFRSAGENEVLKEEEEEEEVNRNFQMVLICLYFSPLMLVPSCPPPPPPPPVSTLYLNHTSNNDVEEEGESERQHVGCALPCLYKEKENRCVSSILSELHCLWSLIRRESRLSG